MRLIRWLPLITMLLALPLQAQSPWCGYALIEGLPLLENQLSVIAALTPAKDERSAPHEVFQYRYNLARTAVIVEGCFQAEPTREVMISLLEQTVDVQLPEIDQLPVEVPIDGGELIDRLPTEAPPTAREYIDSKLTYTRFAPEGTREESAEAVRAYLIANAREWEATE